MGGPCRCAGVATETSKRCGSSRSGLPPPRHEALTATSTIDFTELRRIPFRLFGFLPFRAGPVSGTFQSPSTADVREFTAARTLYSNRLNATPVRRRMREYREPQRIAFHAGPDTLRTRFSCRSPSLCSATELCPTDPAPGLPQRVPRERRLILLP